MWSPGDIIAQVPPECRPESTCVFAAIATAAPMWPIRNKEELARFDGDSDDEDEDDDNEESSADDDFDL